MNKFIISCLGITTAMIITSCSTDWRSEPHKTISLFDGKTLSGWIQSPSDTWTVKDGAIASKGISRGVIYTKNDYSSYRLQFTVRHVSGNPDHEACVLFFCTRPQAGQEVLDALAGIQFQIPPGYTWDYRPGHNNDGGPKFKFFPHRKFDPHEWSQIEMVVNAKTGTARLAVAQPVGSRAVEIVAFSDSSAGKSGPIALQMHNQGLFDEYKDIRIEIDPDDDKLITVK